MDVPMLLMMTRQWEADGACLLRPSIPIQPGRAKQLHSDELTGADQPSGLIVVAASPIDQSSSAAMRPPAISQ
jgi:hypothetical protein